MQQEKPSTLQILDAWDPIQKDAVLLHNWLEVSGHAVRVTQWRPEQLDALSVTPNPGTGVLCLR